MSEPEQIGKILARVLADLAKRYGEETDEEITQEVVSTGRPAGDALGDHRQTFAGIQIRKRMK